MNLFAEYIQPLTLWLENHPHWALLITCLISLSESLAIIGSIVPGSVTMTAIGILAGSGILRIDLTLLAAILGAVAGDSLSYALGYIYSEKITELWPFSKYPHWISYGKAFFAKHGGKSVLLGRFVGPLRSIIPLIAGVLHMRQLPFLTANIISAIGWSLLYVMPGVFIGAAVQSIPPENATRLFAFILAFLLALWLLGFFISYLIKQGSEVLKNQGERLFLHIKKHPRLYRYLAAWTPGTSQSQLYTTLSLWFVIYLALVFSLVLCLLQTQAGYFDFINKPIFFFLQSIRTGALYAFFISCTQFTSPITLACVCVLCFFWFYHCKRLSVFGYVLSCVMVSLGLSCLLLQLFAIPLPPHSSTVFAFSFPAVSLTVATSLYVFLLCYIKSNYAFFTKGFLFLAAIVLGLSGLGSLYIGDYWFTDILGAYGLGICLALSHYLLLRKQQPARRSKASALTVFFFALLALGLPTALSTGLYYKSILRSHTPIESLHFLEEDQWWTEKKPLLPLYLTNRLGKRAALLNVQYLGELDWLENQLSKQGWQKNQASFFGKLLLKMDKSPKGQLPLLDLLFENKRPISIMTRNNKQGLMILSLWSTNYYIRQANSYLWIGSLSLSPSKGKKPVGLDVSNELSPALEQAKLRIFPLPANKVLPTLLPTKPVILLIKK